MDSKAVIALRASLEKAYPGAGFMIVHRIVGSA